MLELDAYIHITSPIRRLPDFTEYFSDTRCYVYKTFKKEWIEIL